MSSLKQTVIDAVLRVTNDSKYRNREYETPNAAREDFVKALIAELFPESPDMPGAKIESVEIPVLEEAMSKLTLDEKPKPVRQHAKPGPKPKPKPEGPVNIEKLNPTQTKKLKAASEESGAALDKKAFLAYLNGLTSEQFDDKKFEDHIKDFLAPAPAEKPAVAQLELVAVDFDGQEYLVDPTSKKVYKENGPVCEHVGDVGLAKFADMEIPED